MFKTRIILVSSSKLLSMKAQDVLRKFVLACLVLTGIFTQDSLFNSNELLSMRVLPSL